MYTYLVRFWKDLGEMFPKRQPFLALALFQLPRSPAWKLAHGCVEYTVVTYTWYNISTWNESVVCTAVPSFFCLSFFSFNVSGLLACVCCACRIHHRWHVPLQHYDVLRSSVYVYLCRRHRACISLLCRMKNQHGHGRSVLDIDG